ncbi:MAG: hypothetical protein JRH01_07855 [Deltaproteobacteria bacterium]|nr:hypothetical protein [Deltaproteobacteria bacterium]
MRQGVPTEHFPVNGCHGEVTNEHVVDVDHQETKLRGSPAARVAARRHQLHGLAEEGAIERVPEFLQLSTTGEGLHLDQARKIGVIREVLQQLADLMIAELPKESRAESAMKAAVNSWYFLCRKGLGSPV